ncbi:MAG: UDP-N-acetylmuramate--L-alanine ligase [Actinomycetota bacterium]
MSDRRDLPPLYARAGYAPPAGSIPTMAVPILAKVRQAHLIGVGGAGMSGIARLLLARGIEVTGSDLKDGRGLDELRMAGARIHIGHDAAALGDPDVVVISSAIPERNPELVAARERGIPLLARAQALAALASGYRTVAIAGTHGKTTTTSMLAVILERCGVDPTFVIGGHLNESGSGARHGAGDVFVAEADESDGSFLLLSPDVGIVTNVEPDHLDFYSGGFEEIEAAFAAFVLGSKLAVVCGDDPGVRGVLARIERSGGTVGTTLTYGLQEGNDVLIAPGEHSAEGISGEVVARDGRRARLVLRRPGVHTLLNGAAAVLAATAVGVPLERAAEAVGTFTGVHRRFEHRGSARGATFIDDYAHHPTELVATLAAAQEADAGRIVAVFQPHRYSRTQQLWRSMGASLAGADVAVITDVYAAGEEPIPGVTGKLLVDSLAEHDRATRIVYLPHRADVAPFLASEVRAGDLVLTLGAGDVTMVTDEVLDRLEETG